MSPERGKHYDRIRDRAGRRFLLSVKTLAEVKRMTARMPRVAQRLAAPG